MGVGLDIHVVHCVVVAESFGVEGVVGEGSDDCVPEIRAEFGVELAEKREAGSGVFELGVFGDEFT